MACEPDNIKWENIGYSKRQRRCRAAIVWFIAILLIVASLIGIVIMKNKTTELKKEYKTDMPCPLDVSKSMAWNDEQLDQLSKEGLMSCYCKPLLTSLNVGIYDHSFLEYVNA